MMRARRAAPLRKRAGPARAAGAASSAPTNGARTKSRFLGPIKGIGPRNDEEAYGAAALPPRLGRSLLLGIELQRLFQRDLFAILIDVVDVPRAVARGRQYASLNASGLVWMLAGIIEIISSREDLWGLAFHL